MQPVDLRCEYFQNPLGIDASQPRLSWLIERGRHQTAFQIIATREGGSPAWDSGRVKSGAMSQIPYAGERLRSGTRYHWRVRVWDEENTMSDWSEPGWWEMGLLRKSDWKAGWIGTRTPSPGDRSHPCPHLRREFSLDGRATRARAYVTALGVYELWINGRRVGEDCFTPGWTDYAERTQYQTYDVTDFLRQGRNAIGAILGEGWFCGSIIWQHKRMPYGSPPRLLAQLVVEHADGRTETIVSNESWKLRTGAIRASDFYHGESCDARMELKGWSEPGFAADDWETVRQFEAPRITVNASASPRVRRIGEIKPRTISEPAPGVFVFDLGQNMVGWARLAVAGAAGTTVTLRFAEMLNPDGSIYTASLRAARCTDQYTLRGGGREIYEPKFTFHGFRYVEVTGFPGRPTPDAITGVVLHTDTRPTGTFECSNAMLNQLQSNIVWGQKGNFLEVPTDCPQRDERLGWTCDAQVFCRTGCFNADVAGFFTKWNLDLEDAQSAKGAFPMMAPEMFERKKGDGGPAWADAGIICPWTIYLCYGDTRILESGYAAMLRYMDYIESVDCRKRHGFGDWLNIGDPTPKDLIGMAFNAHAANLMSRIARVLGRKKDAARFEARFQRTRVEFNREFVTRNGRLAGDSQTAYVLALHFDLLPSSVRPAAVERFVQRVHECNDHLSTGFVGTPYILDVLTRFGHLDLAYKLLLNEDFPSWGYPIKQGATTMWERWDGWRHDKGFQDPGMNSFNHYAYGAVGDWMYRVILGLDLDEARPGYRHFHVRPIPGGGLTWARGSYQSVSGTIEVAWRIKGRTFALEVTVPCNTTATVRLPDHRGGAADVGPGIHRFKATLRR